MPRIKTNFIVIHCSLSKPSMNVDAKVIDRWHREKSWLKIGYARVIKRDGTIEQGRQDDEHQAHAVEINDISTSVCLVGGLSEDNQNEDNFTSEQWESLKKLLSEWVIKYPDARIIGHYHINPAKTCPNFDVDKYLLQEDIPNYKWNFGYVDESDVEEHKKADAL